MCIVARWALNSTFQKSIIDRSAAVIEGCTAFPPKPPNRVLSVSTVFGNTTSGRLEASRAQLRPSKKMPQTLQIPGWESPLLRSYDFRYENDGILKKLRFSRWAERGVPHLEVDFGSISGRFWGRFLRTLYLQLFFILRLESKPFLAWNGKGEVKHGASKNCFDRLWSSWSCLLNLKFLRSPNLSFNCCCHVRVWFH